MPGRAEIRGVGPRVVLALALIASAGRAHEGGLVPPVWDLGEVSRAQTSQLEVVLSVRAPARVVRAQPSCDCLDASIARAESDAAAAASVLVRFRADGVSTGAHEEAVFVHWVSGGEEHVSRLVVRFRIAGDPARPAKILLFVSRDAIDGPEVLGRVREFRAETGLEVEVLEMEDLENFKLLHRLERAAAWTDLADLELFVDGVPYGTRGPVLRQLDALAARHRLARAESEPEREPAAAEGLPLRLFAAPGCRICERVRRSLIEPLMARHGEALRLEEFDVRRPEGYGELLLAERRAGRLAEGPVSVEVGEGWFLTGPEEIEAELGTLIEAILQERAPRRNPGRTDLPVPDDPIRERFLGFAYVSILLAGLADGVNPCAFVTAVLLLSMLRSSGATPRRMLQVGAVFLGASYLTYFAIGVGAYALIDRLQSFQGLARPIVWLTAAGAGVLAVLSLADLLAYARSGRAGDVVLQLPLSLKLRIHAILRERTRTGTTLLGAAGAAVLVTLIEASCTGQVYLPTLVLVSRHPDLRFRAWICLAGYVGAFVLPLAAIWILAWQGASSSRLQEWSRRNVVLAKGAMAIVFAGLAGSLLALAG